MSFDNIRSSYILKQIFEVINEYKKLKIINYNKKIQERIDISILDYKKFLEIELELKLGYNTFNNNFISKYFIDVSSLHIYFNEEKEEQKRTTVHPNEKISKINIVIDTKLKSLKNLFQNCSIIKEIKIIKFNRRDITDISAMFYECYYLTD